MSNLHLENIAPDLDRWLDNNSFSLNESYLVDEVISTELVEGKLVEILQGNYQEKAQILFEIVQPQTIKTLREITPAELRELAVNFKDDLQ